MKKIVDYILSVIFFLSFGLLLVIFHPIQWLCLRFGGYAAHKRSVDLLNGGLVGTYALLGNRVRFVNHFELPSNRPIVFVANHQSMFDIPPLIWFLRKYHAKFISKIELTKGIPSVSFNLKYGGGANIDRKDPKQAVAAILQLAGRMKEKNWSAVIFPEGTRSKDGKMKAFNVGGIATILKKVPHALIVPIAIHNSWKMQRNGGFPVDTFNTMIWEVLEPIEPAQKGVEELVSDAEQTIRRALGQ